MIPSYIFIVMSPFLILPFFQITLSSALPQPIPIPSFLLADF